MIHEQREERGSWQKGKMIFICKNKCCQPVKPYKLYHMTRHQILQTTDAMNQCCKLSTRYYVNIEDNFGLRMKIYIDYIASKSIIFFHIKVEIRQCLRFLISCILVFFVKSILMCFLMKKARRPVLSLVSQP
jgi:hypothetical protein